MKHIFLLLVCAVLLSACGDEQKKLVGLWSDGENTLEFKADGSWFSESPDRPYKNWGTWKIDKDGRLIMGYSNPPFPVYHRVHSFSASGDKLVLKDFEGIIRVHPKSADAQTSEEGDGHGGPDLGPVEGVDLAQEYVYRRI